MAVCRENIRFDPSHTARSLCQRHPHRRPFKQKTHLAQIALKRKRKSEEIFYTFSLFFHLHFYSFPCEKLKIIFPSTHHPPTHTTNLPIFFEAIYYRGMASGHSYQHSREFILMCVVFSFLLAFTSFSPFAVMYSEPADDNIRRNGKENSNPFHRLIFLRVGSSFVRTNTTKRWFGI